MTLLIIDDDEILCESVKDYFDSESCHVLMAHTGADGLRVCSKYRVDVVLLDQKLPDAEGYTLCPDILKTHEHAKIIFITAYSSFDNAIKAIQTGAHDYLSKPFELEALALAIQRAARHGQLEKIEEFQTYQLRKQSEDTVLVGEDPAFQNVLKLIDVASRSDVPVLITGETGTGKSVIAKRIHYLSAASSAPFIPINCNSLPDHLFEAELFGHERGAFTDAQKARKGIFSMADGGSLLLDEIGCMPMHLQSKILTVLDERKFKKLGSDSFVSVNVRLMAATNADLQESINRKEFREDLYYRLNVIRIHVPPLRHRLSDIHVLTRHLLKQMGQPGHVEIDPEEIAAMQAYHWPGNVRELKNILERAVIFQEGDRIMPSKLLQMVPPTGAETLQTPVKPVAAVNESEVIPLSETENRCIAHALEVYDGNMSRTAKMLGISLSTLKRKVKIYNIVPPGR